MKSIVMTCIVLLATASGVSSQRLAVDEILDKEGRFVFTDGASYFEFRRDGTFNSGPLNLSGRVITGRWAQQSPGRFTIEGTWTWQNGLSTPNDLRRMTMIVHSAEGQFETQRISLVDPWEPVRVYRSYFTIDEVVQTAAPPGATDAPQNTARLNLTVPGKVAAVTWVLGSGAPTIQIMFAGSVRAGQPQPPHAQTQVWLLRADGTAITATHRPNIIGIGSGGYVDYRAVHSYPESARNEAIAVVIRVDDQFVVETLPRI